MNVMWQPKAIKQMRKIGDRSLRQRISLAVDKLELMASMDDCPAAKKLSNHRFDYRLRMGNWRILINVFEGEPIIASIEEVKKRDERTY